MNDSSAPVSAPPRDREISGRWAILAMALFGITMTVTMWVYWKMHLSPFLALQQAIHEKFEESRPVVEGGREKGRPENPLTLRITMKIDFPPEDDPAAVDALLDEVLELVHAWDGAAEFEQLEFNVYWPKQETELKPPTAQRLVPLK